MYLQNGKSCILKGMTRRHNEEEKLGSGSSVILLLLSHQSRMVVISVPDGCTSGTGSLREDAVRGPAPAGSRYLNSCAEVFVWRIEPLIEEGDLRYSGRMDCLTDVWRECTELCLDKVETIPVSWAHGMCEGRNELSPKFCQQQSAKKQQCAEHSGP